MVSLITNWHSQYSRLAFRSCSQDSKGSCVHPIFYVPHNLVNVYKLAMDFNLNETGHKTSFCLEKVEMTAAITAVL